VANLLVASIDASGATNSYGGFIQVSKTIPIFTYTMWWPQLNGTTYVYITHPWNQEIVASYTLPLPTKITNAVGYVSSITYDGSNRVSSVRSLAGLTTTNSYDPNGFLTKVVDIEIGRTNSYTHANGLIQTEKNERGLLTTYTWDNLNRMLSKSDVEGTISNVYTRLDLTATKNKLGGWTYFGFDSLQHMVAVTNENNEIKLASYCSCGALEWKRDAITNYIQYGYDLAGRLTSIQYADGYTVTNFYNSLNQLIKTADPLGFVTNTYNIQGLVTLSANNFGVIQSNSFDILDRPLAATDNRGIVTAISYDKLSRVLTNIVAGNLTNSFLYASNGLVRAIDGLLTNVTGFANDQLGRVLIRTNANGEITSFHLDSSGNTTNIIDGKSQSTTFQFDAFNRLTNKLDQTQVPMLQLTYDANCQVKSCWTPQKGTTSFVRDPVGRIRTNNYPHDPQVVYTYDPNGHIVQMTDAVGTDTITYSPTGQPETEGGLWTGDTVTKNYNNQLRSNLSLGTLTTTFNYDAAHRLKNIISANGTYTYSYHPGYGGNFSSPLIQSLSLPNTVSVTNGYDSAGRLNATMLLNSTNGIFDSQQYVYDADSRRTLETRYDNSAVAYGYDNIGQVTTATAKESNGTTARLNEQFSYSYDKAGNLSTRTNTTLALAFRVNSVNELTNVTRSGTLTAAGNTAQVATSVSVNGQGAALYGDKTFATTAGISLNNGGNSLTTVVQYASAALTNVTTSQLPTPVAYLNDANGNLTNDGLRSFSYDDQNRLTSVSIANQTLSVFVYDGFGRRRISRDFNWNGTWVQTNEVHYVYDDKLVIQERDANNNILVSYDRGLDLSGSFQGAGGSGGLLARTDIKGTIYYHSDAQGNVVTLVDRYQTLEGRYLYDPYGNTIGKWGPYVDINHYRFGSMEYLPLSGIYNSYRRYYDPNLQRFLNRDPLGEAGGINLFGYVGNDPINSIDPYGLCPWSWNRFGNWELGVLTSAKELFIGNASDYRADPNSLLYLSNQAGVGNTPLTDQNGNVVSATDLAFDVFTQPLIALTLGGLGDIAELFDGGEAAATGGRLAAAADTSESVIPSALRAGQLAEGPALDAIGSLGKVIFTPTAEQIDSAAFKVIVADAKYTSTGAPISTIYDGSTASGLAEIKSGSSVLNSTYQLRLQTYGALINDQKLTIFTSRPVNSQFSAWLSRWGVSVKPLP
jgi:RHS repeat-associated protein